MSGEDENEDVTVIAVVPSVSEDWPVELKDAMARRNEATVTGRCACGAVLVIEGGQAWMAHDDGCSVPEVQQIAERLGVEL